MAPGDPRGCLLFSRRMSARRGNRCLYGTRASFCPGVGFIVTNLARPAERIVAFYNHRGTCEQWIKQGEGAIGHRFAGPALYARVKCFAVDVKSETIAITDPGSRAKSAK